MPVTRSTRMRPCVFRIILEVLDVVAVSIRLSDKIR
jgi:hypothetical protein